MAKSTDIKPADSSPAIARVARLIARAANCGALATFRRARRELGQPYVSKVGLALDLDGSVLFLFSTLAAHTQDLLADPRCSVLVEGASVSVNPLEAPRATLVGRAEKLHGDGAKAARDIYLARHPGAAVYVDFGDFAFWRLDVQKVHYVGGFGRAKWTKGMDYHIPVGDLAARRESLIERLNTQDKVQALQLAGLGRGWSVQGIDSDGIAFIGPKGRESRLDFATAAKDTKAWRARFSALAQRLGKS